MTQDNETGSETQVNHNGTQPPPTSQSSDELFDRLVSEEVNVGLMVDIISTAGPMRRLLVGPRLYDISDEYQAALRRRITRLSNGRRGDDRLRWDSEDITMHTQPDPTKGSKSVCCIAAVVPIIADAKCQCGKKDYKCREHRKVFRVIFIFDLTPISHSQRTAFKCRNRHVDETLDRALDYQDRRAWDEAREAAARFDWPDDDMELRWLWLRVSRGFTSAANNSFSMDRSPSQL